MEVTLKAFKEGAGLGKLQCDYIVTAAGQRGKLPAFGSISLTTDSQSRIVADVGTGKTSYSNVFAAGDILSGNHASLIGAIASGKKAAVGVRQLLEGYPHGYEGQKALDILNAHPRMGMKSVPSDHDEFDEAYIEVKLQDFYLFQACGKCDHCIENFGCPALIKVGGKVVVDDKQCTRCGLCIAVCLNDAIRWAKPREADMSMERVLTPNE